MDDLFRMMGDPRIFEKYEGGRNQREAQLTKDARIASFTARVEAIEEVYRETLSGGMTFAQTHSDVRKKQGTAKKLSDLVAISAKHLEKDKTHKGRVFYCRSVVRCMFQNSLSTLVEDASGELVSLQVYNTRGVKTVWEAQRYLPEGSAIAILEPFFKMRADGTLGIRVDDPNDIAFDVTSPTTPAYDCDQTSLAAEIASVTQVSVEARLIALANDGLGQKRLHKQLHEEGYKISENAVRKMLQEFKSKGAVSSSTGRTDSTSYNHSPGNTHNACVDTVISGSAASGSKGNNDIYRDAQQCTESVMSGVPATGTRVVVHGLQNDAARHLNGQEGTVIGQDLAKSRVLVSFAEAGEKAVKFENLRSTRSSAAPLPIPRCSGVASSLGQLLSEERWVEAIVFGQCLDAAFLSHSMPVELIQSARGSGSFPECLISVVEAIVEAYRKSQFVNPSAGPDEMENVSSILPLCEHSVAVTGTEVTSLSYALALFLRGVVNRCMLDWQAAALDYRAAYVASEGRMPWILKSAGWCMVSSTDGLPLVQIQANDTAAEQMHDIFLHYSRFSE